MNGRAYPVNGFAWRFEKTSWGYTSDFIPARRIPPADSREQDYLFPGSSNFSSLMSLVTKAVQVCGLAA
jgi:hypothetical protein